MKSTAFIHVCPDIAKLGTEGFSIRIRSGANHKAVMTALASFQGSPTAPSYAEHLRSLGIQSLTVKTQDAEGHVKGGGNSDYQYYVVGARLTVMTKHDLGAGAVMMPVDPRIANDPEVVTAIVCLRRKGWDLALGGLDPKRNRLNAKQQVCIAWLEHWGFYLVAAHAVDNWTLGRSSYIDTRVPVPAKLRKLFAICNP